MNSQSKASDFASQLSANDQETLAVLLDQYLARIEQGDEPNLSELCLEHADLAPAIRHYVESLRVIKQVVDDPDSPATRRREHFNESTDRPDKQIGDYKIVREIGRGGMGVVYEAFQISLGRRVALKLLPFAAVLDPRQIARFQNEAQAAAQLHHPNIVPVYSIGSDRGTYFYSMQFIDGQSLERVIAGLQSGCDSWNPKTTVTRLNGYDAIFCDRNGTTVDGELAHEPSALAEFVQTPVSTSTSGSNRSAKVSGLSRFVESTASASTHALRGTESIRNTKTHVSARTRNHVKRIAQLGVQAAEALHYAHQHGIVHRDIKPSNLLIDRDGKLWIADFGLAQCGAMGSLTRSGDVFGTLRYMSPEQAAGKTHWIDNRTDIYSLGLTLYELLTLNSAIQGNDRIHMLRQIEAEQPTSPSRLNPSVPVELENIIIKSISKEREDRYATAGELAEDLQRWLDGKTTLARRPSIVDRAARWVSRNARLVTIGAAILLLLFAITTVTTSWFRSKNREIIAASDLASKHLKTANEVVDRFGARLLTKLEWLPGTEELQQEVAQNSIEYLNAFAEYASRDPKQRTAVGKARLKLAKLQELRGADMDAIDSYRRAIESLSVADAGTREETTLGDDLFLCRNNLACALLRIGSLNEAGEGFRECLQWVDSKVCKNDSQLNLKMLQQSLLRLNLGHLYRERGENRLAEKELESAWNLIRKVNDTTREVNAEFGSDLQPMLVTGLLQAASTDSRDDDSAIRLLNVALNVAQKHAGSNADLVPAQHDVCVCQLALGACMFKNKDLPQAKEWFEKAIAGLKQLARRSPNILRLRCDEASALNNLGQTELEQGNTLAAMEAFSASRKLLEDLALSTSDYTVRSNLGGILHNQAIVEESKGNREVARSLLVQAIDNQKLALQIAPDCKRCQKFLTEHTLHLSELSGKVKPIASQVDSATNDEGANEKF